MQIGIYIGREDADIAAWFNLLQFNGQCKAKWVRGLIAAYSLNESLDIGTIDPSSPPTGNRDAARSATSLLSGTGSSATRSRYNYGWHIRGKNKEYVQGSVISITLRGVETQEVLGEAWRNGHKLSTFIKALIRDNLKLGTENICPNDEDLRRMVSRFLIAKNSQKVELTDAPKAQPQSRGEGKPKRSPRSRPVAPKKEDAPAEKPASSPPPVNFAAVSEPKQDTIPTKPKNPLLSQI